jgi:predicted CXXCH cytochrome family protein
MSSSQKVLFLSVSIAALLLHNSSDAKISIAYPPNEVLVSESSIAIVGTCDESGSIRINVQGGSSLSGKEVPIQYGGFTVRIKVGRGISNITLTAPSGESSSIQVAFAEKRAGFTDWMVHEYQDHFSNCSDCHRVNEKRMNYKRMSMGTASCRTGDCHGEMGVEAEFVHGPVAGGVCISCHNPHGSPNNASISRTGADQCLVCHDGKREEFQQAHQHSPVKDGDCTGCHDPHQSNSRYQLRGEGQDLCFRCHDQEDKIGGNHVHGPVEVGECDACHNPHASPYPYQLMAEGNQVCFECHEEKLDELKKRHVHPPAEEECTNCHDVHTDNGRAQLASDPPDICWECHSDLGDQVAASTIPHPPVKEGQCGKCHDFHASSQPVLLKQEMVSLCSSCHDDMGEHLTDEPNKHGPVIDNDCSACHTPHGGKFPTLLAQYFPPPFYNPYQEGLYSLCFQCHNADIARDQQTTTLTDFRDGSRNLHYLHINKRKGRSCKACHDIHASDQSKHIRRSVPFGDFYEYPITFAKTEDGGSCMVGCHKPKKYSRLKRQ